MADELSDRKAVEEALARERAARLAAERLAQENAARFDAAERLAQERIEAAERDAQARIEAAERRFDEERAARLDAIDAKKAAERDAQARIEAAERDAQARAKAQIQAANDAKMAAERLAQERIEAAERDAQARAAQIIEEADERIEAVERNAEERIEAADSRWKGTYYSTISEVWGIESVAFEQRHFTALFRKNCPAVYVDTLTAAKQPKNTAANESDASRSSMATITKDNTWPTDIFGRQYKGAEIAHLIPAASSAAETYDDVVSWVTGHREAAVSSKIIHGSRSPAQPYETKRRREPKTGLKHLDCNKIRLNCQDTYIDKSPCVVIVPAMTLDAMLSWNGEQYDAIVMVDKWKKMSADEAATIGITYIGGNQSAADTEATNDEIDLARERMVDVLCGLAYSLSRRRERYRISHNLFNIQGEITVPTAAGTQPAANRCVRKVRFGLAGLHPAPDPMLLTIKSALVWSVRNEQRLLAGGEQNDDDDNSSIPSEEDVADETREQPYWPMAREEESAMNQLHRSTEAHGDALKPPTYVHVPLPTVGSSHRAPMTQRLAY